MTFDPIRYKTSTRRQWQDDASGWNDRAPLLETWLAQAGFRDVVIEVMDAPVRLPYAADCVRFERESFGALHQMHATLETGEQAEVWDEIERALSQYDTGDGFVGPCELVIAGATR